MKKSSSKSVLLDLESKTDSDSSESRSSTPTVPFSPPKSPSVMSEDDETTPRIKRKLGRRLSYLIKDLQEVSSSSLISSSASSPSSVSSSSLSSSTITRRNNKRAEILLKKQPINGWGFSRWCYASIAIGRVAGLSGLTPLILYGTESLTPSSKIYFSPSRLITSCSKKANRRSSSLQIVQTSETTATSRESAIQEAKGSPMVGMMRPVSPTPSLKLIDAPAVEMTSVSSPMSSSKEDIEEEEDDEVVLESSKEQEECFVTPKRRVWSSSSSPQPGPQPGPQQEYSTGQAHRKYAILVSMEDEIHEMMRRIRCGDLRHLCVTVLNISNQRRRIYLSFRKYDDALCFFENALEAIVEANVRNLCDAVTMNRKGVVELYTDTKHAESRRLAINITRKDRRSHTALDYAIHYKDETMIEMLQEAAVLSCTSVAALAALRAAKYADANAKYAARLAGCESSSSNSNHNEAYLSEITYIDDDGTVRTQNKMNPSCFWF